MITWQDRYDEWQALLDYAIEQLSQGPRTTGITGAPDDITEEFLCLGGEINTVERARAMTLCLQRHWVEVRRLGGAEMIDGMYEPWLRRFKSG